MKKVLFCATVDYHFKAFHLPYMKWFQEQGWEVHIAANGDMELPYTNQKYNIPIQRSPFHTRNIEAYKELKKIMDGQRYDIIHCHTPMGGMLARLAARSSRRYGTKVIYTAHGFHFCKGAPLQNWLMYYPIEKWMSRYTDCLITINGEDYNRAIQNQFRAKEIQHVHGVGVDTDKFKPVSEEKKQELRKQHGYQNNDFLMFYAAEFNKNKNQQLLLHSLAHIKEQVPHARLLLAGRGPLEQACRDLAKELGIEHMVDFLGYRNDIHELLPMCDIAVASSLREGLPVNIMEAMACGLPVVASSNRGHCELIRDNQNGWIIEPTDTEAMSDGIRLLAADQQLKSAFGMAGRRMIEQQYSIEMVLSQKTTVYQSAMNGGI